MLLPAKLVKDFRGAGLLSVSVDQLVPHSDLTFKVFENMTVEGVNAHQSLLNGCLIRNCEFSKVRFSRCDLEQVQFQNCRFIDVDFRNVELTSAQISQSNFENCNFESALISDCVWRNCTLDNCSFQQAVIHTSQFDQCQLKNNNLRGALKWSPKIRPSVKLGFSRSARCEKEQIDETKTKTV